MSDHIGEEASENKAITELKRFLFSEGYTESSGWNESTVLTSPDKYRWVTIESPERNYEIGIHRGSTRCSTGVGGWENLSMEELPEIYEELGF